MGKNFKKYLLAGLLVWLPLAITIWVLHWLWGILDGVFEAILHLLVVVFPATQGFADRLHSIPGLSVLLVVLALLLSGVLAANLLGQWVLRQSDRLLQKIPGVRSIYTSVKQVSDTLFSSNGNAFSKALLVQYPRQGSWTIAFLTGQPQGKVLHQLQHLAELESVKQEWLSVYVPTTPNPTSGFFLLVPMADVRELDMSVDEALKYVISMGVVAPAETASSGQSA